MEDIAPFQTLMTTVREWTEAAIQMLPNLAVALVVLLFFYALGRLVRRGLDGLLSRSGVAPTASNVITRIAQIAALLAGVAAALGVLELTSAAASILAGAGVVGLAVGFAFQDIAANFIAGVVLSFRQPFQLGDIIEIEGHVGHVREMNLRTTRIETFDGRTLWVPNKMLFDSVLQNLTGNGRRRMDLVVGVSYGDDLDHVERVTLDALRGIPGRDDNREPEVLFTGFGGSSIDLVGRVWVEEPDQKPWLTVRHEAVKRIATAYNENDITIPFPIRTLDFGIKGGLTLQEAMPASNGAANTDGHAATH